MRDLIESSSTLALLERYDRPGPRYTSYPTADRFIEAFGAAAADLGLPAKTAGRLALATVEGAAALAAASRESPAELAHRVTSPNGTTEAGLKALDQGNALRMLLERTLRAARDRGAELAAEARRKG